MFQINTRLALSAAELNIQHSNPARLCIYIVCIFSAHLESIILLPGVKTAACSHRINSLPAACRLLSRWPSSFTQLQCDVVAWQRQARQWGGAGCVCVCVCVCGGGGVRARAGRQARKRRIIPLCIVCRLKLHSSDTRPIKKGLKCRENDFKEEKKKSQLISCDRSANSATLADNEKKDGAIVYFMLTGTFERPSGSNR